MAMFGGAMAPSLADIAAVTRNNDGNFANGEGWWVIIILFALFGRNGWGYGNNDGGNCNNCCQNAYDTQAVVQRGFDNQAVINKLNGLENGVCDLGYASLQQTNQLSSQICQSTFGIQQAINADTVANMQNTNALSTQLANCCCDTRAALKDIQYEMATQNCQTNTNVHQTGDAIIQNQNAGFNMLNNTIRDGFCSLEMREMQRENADLRQKLNNCDRDSALQGTASYIINSVRPTPIPAWQVENPWSSCGCGYNNGSCCGNRNICC